MKHYINKLLHLLWAIIRVILVLIIWPIIVFESVGIAIFFNVSVDIALQVLVGIIFNLIGLYSIYEIRPILEKSKVSKILIILIGWLGSISSILIGISLILNVIKTL